MVMKQTLKTVALAIGCAIAAAQAHAEPVQLTPQDKTFTQRVPAVAASTCALVRRGPNAYQVDVIGITHFHTAHLADLRNKQNNRA
jgi:ribonuclease BN (tRNA processing enzyme)